MTRTFRLMSPGGLASLGALVLAALATYAQASPQ